MSDYLYGIDISGWNKITNHKKVAQSVDFAYIKATEGKTNASKVFRENHDALVDLGVPCGAYHFAWLKKHGIDEPVKQAEWFCKHVEDTFKTDSLIPVLDVESGWFAPRQKIIDWVNQWLEVVEKELGTLVMIYTFKSYWMYKLKEDGIWDRPLWLASTTSIDEDNRPKRAEPKKPIPGWDYTLWQYTHKSKVPGIKGSVDMNRIAREDLNHITAERLWMPF